MSERKARSPNFSNEEKVAVLNLISKYKGIIENKKTDTISVRKKNRAWEKIEAEFNAISPHNCYRDSIVLKKFYENKKKEARKFAADEKHQIRCTECGLPPKAKKDPSYNLVLSMINDKTVYGLTNPFDSDFKNITKSEANPYKHIEYEFVNEDEDITGESGSDKDLDLPLEDDEIIFLEGITHGRHVSVVTPQNNVSTTKDSEDNIPKALHNLSATPSANKVQQNTKRKRPATVAGALHLSNIIQKYDELIDKRLRIADLMQVEYEQKTVEHLKRLELLELEIAIKKQQLNH